jgi:PAS domain S-box-containing protein
VRSVLLITGDAGLRSRLLRVLGDWSVFAAQDDADALKTLRLVEVDLVVRDGARGRDLTSFVARLRPVAPAALVIAIAPEEDDVAAADLALPEQFTEHDLEMALRHAVDRQRLIREVAGLRAQLSAPSPLVDPPHDMAASDRSIGRVLKEFSRLLAAGFDLPRVLELFLDALGELLRPTRAAVLLPDETGQAFRICAHRGVAAQIVHAVRVPVGEGLGHWLATQARPARLRDLTDPEVARQLALLQGVVAVPLLSRGDLVGTLVLGQPVMGGAYGREELEILFDLATHLATTICELRLHEQLQRAKEFNEQILAHMGSGVITIGRDERIGLLNRRAEEILKLSAADVVGQDLRRLPSPLGDMLFETVAHGHTIPKSEIQLAFRGLWLELSTYPIRGADATALGAVLVFEDVTAQKELAAQKHQAEQFQLLARVVGRIADEIKNPLVSINTFVELMDERYDDPDFRKLFSTVVRRDVHRLVQVFEKLAGLVDEGELDFTTVDAQAVVDDVVAAVELSEEALGRPIRIDVARERDPQPVKVDPGQLRKALSYLVWFLAHHSPAEDARVAVSIARHVDGGTASVRILVGSRTATVPAEQLLRLFDPVRMVQESLIDVGPAVSQRVIEALGGQLRLRQGRHELGFLVVLPVMAA